LVGADAKDALTFQCGRVEDLNHLVSTLEYFIRHSRLGRDTALAGMPYPTQGLVLNNDCVLDKLWAGSPADKAGLQLGDHFWSVGKVASKQQSKPEIESGLSALPITFFVASPADWDKAVKDKNSGQSVFFSPKMRKVVLTAS
ncbi:MAG TPA: hypothetical protein VN963_00865, partial [bacterium]|nr:hypothetical protein [bacterium]